MSRRIEVELDGAQASFELLEDLTPKSGAALWESLPIAAPLVHCKWSGEACFVEVPHGPLAALPRQPELAVASIYKGYIVVAPPDGGRPAELLLSYGLAESRSPTGRRYVAPVAELAGDGSALLDALRRAQIEGQKAVVIRRAEASVAAGG